MNEGPRGGAERSRFGVLLATLGLGALALAVLISARRGGTISTAQSGSPVEAQSMGSPTPKDATLAEAAQQPSAANVSVGESNKSALVTANSDSRTREEQHEAWVEARTAELRSLSRKRDPASMEILLSEVRNPDGEIREAALDALTQSGNRAVIPRLIEAAAQTENARDKKAILDVVEFLKLPTLTEVMSGQGTATNRRSAEASP